MPFKNIPIRRKLMMVNLLTSGAVLLLTCAAFVSYEFIRLHKGMLASYTTRAQIIAANSTAALAFQNESDAASVLAALKSDPRTINACIYDGSGKIFAKFPANTPNKFFPASPGKSGYRNASLEVFQPVVQGSQTLGTVYLRSNLSALTDLYRAYSWLAASIFVCSILVAYLLSRTLQKQISVPILALAETARAVSKQRDYSVRAKKFGEDESGLLTDAFNQMLAGIQDRENALSKSQAQLQTIVESLDEGVVVSDINGQLLHFNRAALAMHGFSGLNEILLHLNQLSEIFELSSLDGTVWSVDQWPLSRVMRGEVLHNLEVCIRRNQPDGWRRIFSYGGTLVRDAAGQPILAVVTISDITERKAAEEKIRQLNISLEQRVVERTAELETANKELEAFSYSVSHDLRAPLRAMDGFSQAVQEDYGAQLPEEGRRYLQTIRESAQRMGTLIDDLLMFSRLSRAPVSRHMVDVDKLVREIIEDLNLQHQGRRIEIRLSELPPCRGDSALLKQAWINLLSNAFKYTRKREPAIIEIGCTRENGEHIYFVRDNGAGFDMKYSDKLFGVFKRLHHADEYEGTGVGLAIVQRVIHRHGGQVWAEAKLDEGATFYFKLKGDGEL